MLSQPPTQHELLPPRDVQRTKVFDDPRTSAKASDGRCVAVSVAPEQSLRVGMAPGKTPMAVDG
jgi:hypothetical protein